MSLRKNDVVSLGRAGDAVLVPHDVPFPNAASLTAEIEGVGLVRIPILDKRSNTNYYNAGREGTRGSLFV